MTAFIMENEEKKAITYGDIINTLEKYSKTSKSDLEQLSKEEKGKIYYEIVTIGNIAVQHKTSYAEPMRQLFIKLFC